MNHRLVKVQQNIFKDGESVISLSEANDFIYRQVLTLKEDGVYTTETSQYFKVLLFIKKETTFIYR